MFRPQYVTLPPPPPPSLTLFLARRRWPAPPCLPLDDDLPPLGLAGLSALGGGRQGGLGQDGGHLLAAGGGRPGDQLAGSRHQCCLGASLQLVQCKKVKQKM